MVKKNEKCECCINENFEFLECDDQEIITSLSGRNAIQITPADPKELVLKILEKNLKNSVQLSAQILYCSSKTMIQKFHYSVMEELLLKEPTMKWLLEPYTRGILEHENY